MATKIYYGRDLIGRFTCDGRTYTRFGLIVLKTKRLVRQSVDRLALVSLIGWSMLAGYSIPHLVEAYNVPEVYAQEIENRITLTPVMAAIADCESGKRDKYGRSIKGSASHYDRHGQVLVRGNTNKTVDIGYMQINTIHSELASKLGYDLTKERDNKAFGMYLYETQGTEPWSSSFSCWHG